MGSIREVDSIEIPFDGTQDDLWEYFSRFLKDYLEKNIELLNELSPAGGPRLKNGQRVFLEVVRERELNDRREGKTFEPTERAAMIDIIRVTDKRAAAVCRPKTEAAREFVAAFDEFVATGRWPVGTPQTGSAAADGESFPDWFPKTESKRREWATIYYRVVLPTRAEYRDLWRRGETDREQPSLEELGRAIYDVLGFTRGEKTMGRIAQAGSNGRLEKYRREEPHP